MLKEKKNNFYVKELNKIEQYIVKIFKRYFDVEELNNAGTINFIIEESIKRYKESINYVRSGVDALNGKFGIVNVNIHDFGGEPLFDKNTAFNKDFGQIADTICEGNDPRLTDKREPTEHNHLIKHINGLEEILEEFKIKAGYYSEHIHFNLDVLDKIIYSGTRETIDLIELEQLIPKITPMLQNLIILKYALITEYETKEKIIREMIREPEDIKKYIDELDNILRNIIKRGIPNKINVFVKESKEKIKPYPEKELLDKIKPIANNNSLHAGYQYFKVADLFEETITDISSDNGESMRNMFENGSSAISINNKKTVHLTEAEKNNKWRFNNTANSFECLVNESNHLIFLSSTEYLKYTHEVTLTSDDNDNDLISVILAVTKPDENNNVYPLSLNITANKTTTTSKIKHNFNVTYGFGYTTDGVFEEIAYDDTLTDDSIYKWEGKKIRVKIEREGSVFKIYRSAVNSETLSNVPCIEFDLKNTRYANTLGAIPSAYGYGCYSQLDSKFLGVQFKGYQVNTEINDDPKQITIDKVADNSLSDQSYDVDTIEIQPELVYNNTITKLPFITEDYIIDSGLTNENKIYVRIQKLKEDIELPKEIANGQIRYGIYAQKDLI